MVRVGDREVVGGTCGFSWDLAWGSCSPHLGVHYLNIAPQEEQSVQGQHSILKT